jgi:hypothetical protein
MQDTYLDDVRVLLTRVRRRWITVVSMRAVSRVAAAAAALLLLVLGIDSWLEPADLPMVVLAMTAVVVVLTFALGILWPLRRRPSDRQVARYIEERCPELEDHLASATDVAESGRPLVFRNLVLRDAATKARAVEPDQVIARAVLRGSVLRGLGATVVLIAVLGLGLGPVGRIARTAWLYAFPNTIVLVVEPGDARVVAGEPLRILATISDTIGAPARTLPAVTLIASDGEERRVEMDRVTDSHAYELGLPSVDASFRYRVHAATVSSDEFSVTALVPPRVERIDVAYEYPSFTGLSPRVEADAGDIYAPLGTEVTLTVQTDKPVREGELVLASGERLALRPTGERTVAVSFEVLEDDSYRVAVVDPDGLVNSSDINYFIRTVFDRPPEIEIIRPGGDRDITSLEEVVIEARANDDYGLERFELVYSVIGRDAGAIDFARGDRARTILGDYTIFAEDLSVLPGDFISYYARARDTNTSRQASERRSDIFFLQVRPFDQEFEEAQSQSLEAMDAGQIGELAEVQKEIIVATWKLDRQPFTDRQADDLVSVADAQVELKRASELVAERVLARGRELTPETRGGRGPENEAMSRAVEAMTESETTLRARDTSGAIPPEMEALSHLLKAQAEIRRKQVNVQRGNQGQAGADRAQEDLSELFDRELRREQKTNYENRSSAENEELDPEESEALRRLRELADRQETLTREQQELADRRAELEAQAEKRALDRLTREQNELLQQMEDLRRELDRMQQAQEREEDGNQRLGEIAEQMRRAMSELRRRDPSQAAERGQRALDEMRSLQKQLEGEKAAQSEQALGELQFEAQELAEGQREIASESRRTDPGTSGRDDRNRLAGYEDQLADRVESLQGRIEEMLPQAAGEERQALNGARDDLREQDVASEMRALADRLRRTVAPYRGSEIGNPAEELRRIADADDELADVLEGVANRLQAAGDPSSANAQQLSQQLEDAQELRRSLEQLEQQLEQMAESSSGTPPEDFDPSAAQDQRLGGQVIEPGADPQLSPDGRLVPSQKESGMAGGELAQLQQELMRQLAESPELLEQLSRQRPTLKQDLEQWAQHWDSGPSPGTEAFKQDFSTWVSLRDDVQLALEEFEVARSQELTELETDDRLNIGRNEQMPEEYRRLVEQYYRSLATSRVRP